MARNYSRGGGWTGPLVAVLVLGAVFAGLVFAFWGKIKGGLEGEAPPPVVEKPVKPPPGRVAARKVEKVETRAPKPSVTRPARVATISDYDLRRGMELFRQGEEALGKLDFESAEGLFGKAAGILENDPAAAERADSFRVKAEVFGKVTSDVRLNPEAEGGLVTLKRNDGGDIPDVVLVDETDDAYVIRKRNGIEFEIPRDEVYQIERITPEAQRMGLLDRFRKAERESGGQSGISFFLLAKHAYQDGLKTQALDYLGKAYSKDGAELPTSIRIHEAKQMLTYAFWCEGTGRTGMAKMFCGKVENGFSDLPLMVSQARELRARMAKPVRVAKRTVIFKVRKLPRKPVRVAERARAAASAPSAKEEEVTFVAEKVKSRSSANTAIMGQINDLFDEGMQNYLKGRPGNPRSNYHLGKAAAAFDKVVGLCEKAMRNDPGNSQLESRSAEASRYAYHARKMKTLSLFGG